MDFKSDVYDPKDSPDMTPEKFFEKGTWPWLWDPKFLGVKC